MITIVILLLARLCVSQLTTFRLLTTNDGSTLCAAQNPVYVMSADDVIGIPYGQPGATNCAWLCMELKGSVECAGFNYVTNGPSKECQFYNNPPTYCNVSKPGCAYYQVHVQ